MAGKIFVAFAHRADRRVVADFGQAHVGIKRRAVGAAHGAIVVEQQTRAEDRAVVVQIGGAFQTADGFVEAVVLPQIQGGIKPGRRVVWIELLRQMEFLLRRPGISEFARSLAEIGAKQSALWLQRGGDLQCRARGGELPLLHQTKPAPQPGRAEGGIQFAGAVKRGLSRAHRTLLQQDEALQRVRGREAGSQLKGVSEFGQRGAAITKGELQFRQARMGEAQVGSERHGVPGRCPRTAKIRARLQRVGVGQLFTAGGGGADWLVASTRWVSAHHRDESMEREFSGSVVRYRREQSFRLCDAADGQFELGAENVDAVSLGR